jgi:hypothetical protein
MSGKSHWNLATEPDKAERPNMSGLGGRTCPARVSGIQLEGWIYLARQEFLVVGYIFDVLHFTNSANVSPLIVQSS